MVCVGSWNSVTGNTDAINIINYIWMKISQHISTWTWIVLTNDIWLCGFLDPFPQIASLYCSMLINDVTHSWKDRKRNLKTGLPSSRLSGCLQIQINYCACV